MDTLRPTYDGVMVTVDPAPGLRGELRHEHVSPVHGVSAEQYVYSIGSYHYNWHTALQILVVVTGRIEVCVAGGVENYEPGDVVVINVNAGHATLATQPHSTVLCLHVESDYLSSFTADGAVPHFDCRSTPATRDRPGFARLRTLLARMMLDAHRTGPGAEAAWESRLLDVIAVLFNHFPPTRSEPNTPDPASTDRHALKRAVDYIDGSFRERITLARLARHVGYSPGYLSQVFPQQVGMTFSEYLTWVRLRQAVRDLSETEHLIAHVAADVGFPDVKAFNTAFRRTFERTPSAYRQLLTADTAADSVFHRTCVPRTNEAVMRVLRGWSVSTQELVDDDAPCQTVARLARSSPVDEALELSRALTARLQQLADGAER
ncbi:AraC family transcriptional regulator [Actinomyces sp.]|uniref:AraC family transcriptional regulator n=1 Tax=Actinomyces sp. TaxID=29317 RepID=UPI0026DCE946|nr:AraC family transcriptional regulator [Actinomyces sp.]MDO4900558.1 AraC family transcriptional regulator [Actinomyces sp.]